MKSGMVFSLSLVAVSIMIFSIGIGLSYSAIIEEVDDFGSDYCSITAISDGSLVSYTKIIGISSEPSDLVIGFSIDGKNYRENLTLNYYHTKGTDIVLTIDFSCKTGLEAPVVNCLDSSGVAIGSTLLVGEGTKTGTISGIILPVGKNGTGTVDFMFQVERIDLNTPIQMSFSVHPLEASS